MNDIYNNLNYALNTKNNEKYNKLIAPFYNLYTEKHNIKIENTEFYNNLENDKIYCWHVLHNNDEKLFVCNKERLSVSIRFRCFNPDLFNQLDKLNNK
jgi:hypothetical protein